MSLDPAFQSKSAERTFNPPHPIARGQGWLAMAQINTTPGDLQGNAEKIMRHLRHAETMGLDLVAFPELALMGYPPRDVIIRHPFLVRENMRWLRAIAARTGQTHALVGFVEARDKTGGFVEARDKTGGFVEQRETREGREAHDGHARVGKSYFNALAVLGEGRIQAVVRKCLLPTYGEFEDDRQFERSPAAGAFPPETLEDPDWGFAPDEVPETGDCVTIHGHAYGLSICEDIWNDADFFTTPLYHHDPIAALARKRPEVMINVSASPTRSRKEQMKHNMLSHVARKYALPLVYVNQTGTVDEVSFDGASRVYDMQGKLTARARAFEEAFVVANPLTGEGVIEPLPPGLERTLDAQKVFNAYDTADLGRTYECLRQGINDYFRKTGFERAVIGLSGGLDSSVTVVLLADALGPDNVLGISMPSAISPEDNRTDARQLADNLGIRFTEIPIGDITSTFTTGLSGVREDIAAFWGASDPRSNAADNVQAIARATLLRQAGNEFRALPIATSDKSELYLGYATVNGDMSGALAPIGDLPKTKVRALARWLNENRSIWTGSGLGHIAAVDEQSESYGWDKAKKEQAPVSKPVLPESIITKPSGADLKIDPATGKLITAEEELMPYEFADEVIWRIEALHQGMAEMRTARFQYEETHALSAAQKAEWLEKFFNRMARAVFKWFVAPPILIVEGNGSIAKSDYHHPIVAGRIRWNGHSDAEIADVLDEI